MNEVEDRVRAALRVHAEDFTAAPDAWQQLHARHQAARKQRHEPWGSLSPKTVMPVAAAAAVVIVVAVAATVAGSFGRPGATAPVRPAASSPKPAQVPSPYPGYSGQGPLSELLTEDPAASAVIGATVPRTGNDKVVGYFWLSHANPSYWVDQVTPGLQVCNDTVNTTTWESSGFCWPLPQLGPGHLASATGTEGLVANQKILEGIAAPSVASVAAQLPDGRTVAGVVKSGQGLQSNLAWTVSYPRSAGTTKLIFRNAAGQQVATLGTSAPVGPPQLARPVSGGVTMFSYPAGDGAPAGTMVAYLVQGRVGFWSPFTDLQICPVPAGGAPALGGIAVSFGTNGTNTHAFGYAHAGVTRVVLRSPGGEVSAATFAAGWPGGDVRLWSARLPNVDGYKPMPTITATGYDAAGHVVERLDLGTSNFG